MIFSTDLAELFCRDCIAQQPALKFAFWGGLSLAGTLFCLWRARTAFIHARLIADLPTSRVRSAMLTLMALKMSGKSRISKSYPCRLAQSRISK